MRVDTQVFSWLSFFQHVTMNCIITLWNSSCWLYGELGISGDEIPSANPFPMFVKPPGLVGKAESFVVLSFLYSTQSSTIKRTVELLLMKLGKLLMYKRNSNGPRTLSFGHPR
jgi:hypothetical protein